MNRAAKKVSSKCLKIFKPTLFDSGVGARLPAEYKKFYNEWRNTEPEPVHYIPKQGQWKRDENTGVVKRIQNVPLPGKIPKEMNDVFTGGEMVIQGFLKKHAKARRNPRFWVPITYRSVIYSEILNKYMSVILTKRVVELIHKHEGLDNYLLKTRACDLQTLIALRLKRKLMLALKDKQLPYDEEKNESLIKKYQQYLPPDEEIEWYGLSFTEACNKLKDIEKATKEASVVPLKKIYRESLVHQLRTNILMEEEIKKTDDKWISKVPGVKKFFK